MARETDYLQRTEHTMEPYGRRRTSSVSRTFRFHSDLDDRLRKLADEEGVSQNTVVSRALWKLVRWDHPADKFGFVALPNSMLARLTNYLSEDEARELGRWVGSNLAKDFVIFRFEKMSLETALSAFRLASEYSKEFEYSEFQDRDRCTIVLRHSNGVKWSIIQEEAINAVFRDGLNLRVKTQRSGEQVMAEIQIWQDKPTLAPITPKLAQS